MENALLKLSDVTVAYGRNVVLRNASLSVPKGQILGIIGPNGAGKTSLLRAILGVINLQTGSVQFGDEQISGLSVRDRIRKGLACVPQERNVFANLTVGENLEIATSALDVDQAELKRRTEWVFSLFPRLEERRQQLAGTMSGGEQRMVAVGIGLMASPRLLLLDEPTTGLAPQVVHQLMSAVKTLNSQHGITAIVVEQNILSLLKIVDAVAVIKSGIISLQQGDPGELARRNVWEFL